MVSGRRPWLIATTAHTSRGCGGCGERELGERIGVEGRVFNFIAVHWIFSADVLC
jgi:hypothetical protein